MKASVLTPEEDYVAQTPLVHRKQYGQFFTPPPVADMMARWVAEAKPTHVLDPAVGTGVLIRSVQKYLPDCTFTGFDIDPLILEWAQKSGLQSSGITICKSDFLRSDSSARYEGIIANPPYLKFHDYDNLISIKHIEQELGIHLSGFTNIYALFILKALRQLKKGGRAAFVIPSEFLNSDYGVAIKQELIVEGSLRYVLVVDFKGSVFADALTTACVLLCSKEEETQPKVTFLNLNSVESLATWFSGDGSTDALALHTLNPEVKWRRYYQQEQLGGAMYGPKVSFASIGKASRGIATGDNEYFTFSATKAKKLGLDPAVALSLCVVRATDIPGSFFTQKTLAALVEDDKTIYILDVRDGTTDAVQRYLEKGEQQGVSKKHLPAHRKVWHKPENRLPAPIWVTVFNRGGIRFVRNETDTLNLTTFHSVYLLPIFQARIELVMAYLLTDVAREIFANNRREYGNGLEKFEPNDLNRALMLDLTYLTGQQVSEVEELYSQYRKDVLNGNRNEELRLQIDNYFRAAFTM